MLPFGHASNCVCASFRCTIGLLDLESLHGLSPNVILACKPWGHTVTEKVVEHWLEFVFLSNSRYYSVIYLPNQPALLSKSNL